MRYRNAVWFWLGLCSALAGCDKILAGSLSPDFAGVWDVTYDDSIEVEVRVSEQTLRASVGEQGGEVAFRDAGSALALEIDCTRPELVCPSEAWPRELALKQAPGQLDDDGVQLARPLAGVGGGRCRARPGSILTGEVMSTHGAEAVRSQAVALTSGRVTTIVDANCLAPHAGLPEGTQVALSSGFTAAKR